MPAVSCLCVRSLHRVSLSELRVRRRFLLHSSLTLTVSSSSSRTQHPAPLEILFSICWVFFSCSSRHLILLPLNCTFAFILCMCQGTQVFSQLRCTSPVNALTSRYVSCTYCFLSLIFAISSSSFVISLRFIHSLSFSLLFFPVLLHRFLGILFVSYLSLLCILPCFPR